MRLAAPGMFSTMTAGRPGTCLPRWRAIAREYVSKPPPAVKATTMRMVLPSKNLGWPSAVPATRSAARATSIRLPLPPGGEGSGPRLVKEHALEPGDHGRLELEEPLDHLLHLLAGQR